MEWGNNNNNSSSSCEGYSSSGDNIYDMDVQQLINTFTAGTTEMLGRNSSDPMAYLARVQYMPMKCLLEENRPHSPDQVPRVKTIALWATLFASISWIFKKMRESNPNMDYLLAALRRITYVCALELNGTLLLKEDLSSISRTNEFEEVAGIITKPEFSELFRGTELQLVQACFLKLGVNIITEGVGEMNIDSSESSSSSSSSSSAAAVSPFVSGSWLGRVVAQGKTIEELEQQRLQQQQTIEMMRQQQQQQQRAQASPSIPFAQSTSFTSNFGPPVNLLYATNTGQQPQAQAQGFGARAQVTMTLEEALSVLGYRDIEDIGDRYRLNSRIKDLKATYPDKSMLYTDAGKIIRDNLNEGGKRRTMKVKKHFRKTRNIHSKRVKKTRLRRNNKSKRVLKEKRRR
jgi:hypothetical protein